MLNIPALRVRRALAEQEVHLRLSSTCSLIPADSKSPHSARRSRFADSPASHRDSQVANVLYMRMALFPESLFIFLAQL